MLASVRWQVSCLAAVLAVASTRLAHMSIPWLAVAAILAITVTTMFQNDWRDRFHDIKKGKVFASQHEAFFLRVLLFSWVVTILLITSAALEDSRLVFLLGFMALAGALYSETRLIPMVPLLVVAFTSASPSLVPVVLTLGNDSVVKLFWAAVFVILSTEIIKDLDDKQVDGGYKWTLPVAVGVKSAKSISVICFLIGLGIVCSISAVVIPGVVVGSAGIVLFLFGVRAPTRNHLLNLGMALALLAVILFPN